MSCCWCHGPRQHKDRRGCAGAQALLAISLERKSEIGRQAGKTNAICDREDVLERYRQLDRDDAIWQAWKDSRAIKRWQRYRARKAGILPPLR